MDVHVYIRGKLNPEVFGDAEFTIGVVSLVGQVTPAGAVQNITQYFPTGDLWVFRLTPNPAQSGAVLRTNLAVYCAGKWTKAILVNSEELKQVKKKNAT